MSVCLSCWFSPFCPGAMVVGREESSESLLSGNVHRCSTYKVVRLHKTRMEGPRLRSLYLSRSSNLLLLLHSCPPKLFEPRVQAEHTCSINPVSIAVRRLFIFTTDVQFYADIAEDMLALPT